MKKKLVLTAAVIAALSVVSCNGKKTNNKEADQDSLSYAEKDSLNSNDVVLDSIAGTYEGTLPAADCPGIKTVLTLNADSTYQYSADYLERKANALLFASQDQKEGMQAFIEKRPARFTGK